SPLSAPATPGTSTPSLHDALPICRHPAQTQGRIEAAAGAGIGMQGRHGHQPTPVERAEMDRPRESAVLECDGLPGTVHFGAFDRSEEHTSELQSLTNLVCRLLLQK